VLLLLFSTLVKGGSPHPTLAQFTDAIHHISWFIPPRPILASIASFRKEYNPSALAKAPDRRRNKG